MRAWEAPGLAHGFAVGVAVAASLVAAVLALRHRGLVERRPLPVGGAVIAGAGLALVATERAVPLGVLAGVALVAVGAFAAGLRGPARAAGIMAALVGGSLVALCGGVIDEPGVRLVVALGAGGMALLVGATDQAWRHDARAPALFAVACVGAFLAVPDTEEISLLVGLVLPVAALGWPVGLVRLGHVGGATASAVLVWTLAVGGVGRPSSIVASALGAGLLAGLPIGWALRSGFGRRPRPSRAWSPLAVIALQCAVVAPVSRIAGHAAATGDGLVLSLPSVGVAVAAGWWWGHPDQRDRV